MPYINGLCYSFHFINIKDCFFEKSLLCDSAKASTLISHIKTNSLFLIIHYSMGRALYSKCFPVNSSVNCYQENVEWMHSCFRFRNSVQARCCLIWLKEETVLLRK